MTQIVINYNDEDTSSVEVKIFDSWYDVDKFHSARVPLFYRKEGKLFQC